MMFFGKEGSPPARKGSWVVLMCQDGTRETRTRTKTRELVGRQRESPSLNLRPIPESIEA
jgi:hypothetical protein